MQHRTVKNRPSVECFLLAGRWEINLLSYVSFIFFSSIKWGLGHRTSVLMKRANKIIHVGICLSANLHWENSGLLTLFWSWGSVSWTEKVLTPHGAFSLLKEKLLWHLLKQLRKTLFKTVAIKERDLAQFWRQGQVKIYGQGVCWDGARWKLTKRKHQGSG